MPPPRTGGLPVTNIRNTSSLHWRGWTEEEGPRINVDGRIGENKWDCPFGQVHWPPAGLSDRTLLFLLAVWDMSPAAENVRLSRKTGSDWHTSKAALLTQFGLGSRWTVQADPKMNLSASV
jgi:hypothetical protein